MLTNLYLYNTEQTTDVTANRKQMVPGHTSRQTLSSTRAHAIAINFGRQNLYCDMS